METGNLRIEAVKRQHTPDQRQSPASLHAFTYRVLIIVGIVTTVIGVALFLWYTAQILLLGFAGVLLAVFLRSLSDWVHHYTRLPMRWSLALVGIGLLVLIAGTGWLLAPRIAQQADALTVAIPLSTERLEQYLGNYVWGRQLVDWIRQSDTSLLPSQSTLMRQLTGVFSTAFGALASLTIVLFAGIFLAINPQLYIRGFLRLVPPDRRERTHEVIAAVGSMLRWWLVGRIAGMIVIGVLTTLGLWILGMPLALTLGLISGLLDFIPNIGPVLAFVPAGLIAFTQSPQQVLWVAFLYWLVQTIENSFVVPILLQKTIDMPPALAILAVAVFGTLFGLLGLLVAAPLTATAMVSIRMLYVEDTLGDRDEGGQDEDEQ